MLLLARQVAQAYPIVGVEETGHGAGYVAPQVWHAQERIVSAEIDRMANDQLTLVSMPAAAYGHDVCKASERRWIGARCAIDTLGRKPAGRYALENRRQLCAIKRPRSKATGPGNQ